jgi:hypothetical protein
VFLDCLKLDGDCCRTASECHAQLQRRVIEATKGNQAPLQGAGESDPGADFVFGRYVRQPTPQ